MSADRPQFDDLSGATGPENPILDEIADLLARHKLVPFFGAGMSRSNWALQRPSWRKTSRH